MTVSLMVAALLSIVFLTTRHIAALMLQRLPSTFVHELAHYIVALVLGRRPSGFTLIPKRAGPRSWTLGSVNFSPGTLSTGFIALAPLWTLAPLSYWILWLRPATPDLWTEVLAGVAGAITAWGSIPSATDVSLALRYPIGTAILLLVTWAVLT